MKTLLAALTAALLVASAPAGAAEPAPDPAPSAAAPREPVPALVTLNDGQELRGKLVSQDGSGVTLELQGGARVEVPAETVGRIDLARPGQTVVRSQDPSRTRYLYSPSAFMLRRGEAYLSQTELLLTSAAFGVTDHLTLGLGSCLPVLLWTDGEGMNFVGMVKAGGSLSDRLHLAVGAQALFVPGTDTAMGFLFATATVGTPDAHLSLSAGPPFAAGDGAGDLIVTLSGAVRLSEGVALVSENWSVPTGDGRLVISSGAVRFIGRGVSVDVGLVFGEDASQALPWLDFTWSFGA